MNRCEILAPAGSREALEAAVLNGADAVYLGGSLFNARASASNFSNEELKDAVDFCHLRKVKVYVTVNILVGDREFTEFDKFIRYIDEIGVDAVIVQDIGAAVYIKSIAPSLSLHASTQMTVYDLNGAVFLKKIGFKRVVLARELPYETIREIAENSGGEVEIFVHGAMCVSYSGQCLMSSMIGGRSGNRGKCAQPCRLNYTFGKKSGTLLSLKDMCLIRHLGKIQNCNVASLKIEGRMKGHDYVGTVVSIYRKYLDSNAAVTDSDYKTLERIFYRGGFSDGYFTNKKGADMFCHSKPDNPYLKNNEKLYIPKNNLKKTALYMYFKCRVGKPAKLTVIDESGNTAECLADANTEPANKISNVKDRISDSLNKLGNTVFYAENIEVDADENAFVPVSTVNELRRNALSILENKIADSFRRQRTGMSSEFPTATNRRSFGFELSVFVTTAEQLAVFQKTECIRIYAPIELAAHFNGSETAVLPRVSPENLKKSVSALKNREVLVRNIGQIEIAKECKKDFSIDFTMNVFNSFSAEFYKNIGAKSVTLSAELTLAQIRDVSKITDCESVIYGKLPLMLTENCMLKTSAGCTKGGYIEDRTGESFYVKCLDGCRNEIFNSVPVVMSDKKDDILSSGLAYGRLDFTDESPQKCLEIYNAYKNQRMITGNFTRGKFYKGV